MPINTGIGLVGVAIQDDETTPATKPSFVHGLTGGSPFAFERTVDTIAVACGIRGNIDAYVSETNMNPSVSTLAYQEVAPVYCYGALGSIKTTPAGRGLWKHVITIGETLPSLTIFGQEGQTEAEGFGKTTSCKVNELEISFENTEPLTMTPNLMGCNLVRLDDNPNAGFPPLCFDGYFTPVGGEFKLDTAGPRPATAIVVSGTWTITNDCEPVRDPTTTRPARIAEKMSKAAVSLDVTPDDFELFWRMVTGSSTAKEPAAHIVYGSYYAKFMHSDNPDFTMEIEGNKVPFAAEVPEVDPEGGAGTFTFSSEDSYVDKVGDSPITITIVNDIEDYFDPSTYALPTSAPEAMPYGEVLEGFDAEETGEFHVSPRSKYISGDAKRVTGHEGVDDGYYMVLTLEDWEGATASTVPVSRAAGQTIPFQDGLALVPLGFDSIEVGAVVVRDAAGEETTYLLDVEPQEDLPELTPSINQNVTYGKDPAEFGDYTLSLRSRLVTGTATRVKDYAGVPTDDPRARQGYYMSVVLDPWEGSSLRRRKGGEWGDWLECVGNGVVTLQIGFDDVEMDAFETKSPDGTVETYKVDVKPAEELPTVSVSALDQGSYLGVDYAKAGSFLVSNRSRTVTGTSNRHAAYGWNGEGRDAVGYFCPIHIEGAKEIRTEKNPKGKALPKDGDVLLLLGEDDVTFKWLEVVGCDDTVTRYEFDVKAAPEAPVTNDIGAAKWGFCKKASDLDAQLGEGASGRIDHDEDVFYLKLKAPIGADFAKYAAVFEVGGPDGTTCACRAYTNAEWTESLIGLGPNRTSSHKTDLDFVLECGRWQEATEPVSVDGRAVIFEVRKFAEDVSAESLDGENENELVFGPVLYGCEGAEAHEAAKVRAGARRQVAKAPRAKAPKAEAPKAEAPKAEAPKQEDKAPEPAAEPEAARETVTASK